MASPNEASFDLREINPLSRNILHSGSNAPTDTGQRMNQRMGSYSNGYRDWSSLYTSPKAPAGYLIYPVGIRDTAKSGMGRVGNRRLKDLAESILMNVGGSYRNAKESSPLMSGMSVGGSIVVGARESRVQGEGSQGINALQVESTRSHLNRMM